MNGLRFQQSPAPEPSAPNRADVACFVGYVGRRPTPVPSSLQTWLDEQGWTSPPFARPGAGDLLDVPVPIDGWDLFDALFAWDERPLDGKAGHVGTSYLGAAVRSFFAQGGRRCYVVRVADPWNLADAAARAGRIAPLVPGYPNSLTCSPVDRTSWHGVGHLFGLPDVSFVCLPDLADAVRLPAEQLPTAVPEPAVPEQFVTCSAPPTPPAPDLAARYWSAPRCDGAGFADWAAALRQVADLLARLRREVQLVAAVPLPLPGTAADADLLGFFTGPADVLSHAPAERLTGLASAFVQLAYPWLRTPGSADLPEGLESPDGVLAGVLARNALTRGAFRSAAGLHLADVFDVYPLLPRSRLAGAGVGGLVDRVSLLGPTPAGLRLLSDVTASLDPVYRPAAVGRLVSVLVRACRRLGEEMTFEPSGEAAWGRVREGLEALLGNLYAAGALDGATAADAFEVRCDRSTMTQNDIDEGRLIARVQFAAAVPVDRITVVLTLGAGGQVSLAPAGANTPEAA